MVKDSKILITDLCVLCNLTFNAKAVLDDNLHLEVGLLFNCAFNFTIFPVSMVLRFFKGINNLDDYFDDQQTPLSYDEYGAVVDDGGDGDDLADNDDFV